MNRSYQNGSRVQVALATSLYSQEISFTESYFSTFIPEDLSIDLTDSNFAHLWGQPLIPEDWSDVTIRVYDRNDDVVDIYSYQLLENGAISENTSTGVTWFFAWNIPVGIIRLEVETIDGEPADIESLEWDIWDNFATINYRVNRLYDDNFNITFL